MNALKADPKTVDLRAQAPHFYNIGARMLELFEEEDMVEILTDVGSLGADLLASPANLSADFQATSSRDCRSSTQLPQCT